jgi:hypothetical protein
MTTANGIANARAARKSLGDQIDRLDGILDGLAEALNGAVAGAVRGVIAQTTREAVHAHKLPDRGGNKNFLEPFRPSNNDLRRIWAERI